MKKKTSSIIKKCLAVIAALLLISLLWLLLNPVSYYSFEEDGYSFNYRGSFGKVRRVTIKNGAEKLCTVTINSDSDIFNSIGELSAIIADLDGDGDEDILLPTDYDTEGDVIYSLFISEDNKLTLKDDIYFANPTFNEDEKMIYTSETIKKMIQEKTEASPELYELTDKISKFRFDDEGTLITQAERSIIYYSENDYYCYAIYEHDPETNQLSYIDEIWFDPIKLDQYPLNWD